MSDRRTVITKQEWIDEHAGHLVQVHTTPPGVMYYCCDCGEYFVCVLSLSSPA